MIQRIPNILSGFRLAAAPFLLVLAFFGHRDEFLILLSISLISDSMDGFIARTFNAASELGTRLDSWGDMATYLSVPICAWWLWPDIMKRESFFVFLILFAYLIPISVGFIKFRQLTSYHTWGAKISAVLMSIGVFFLFLTDIVWIFRSVAVVQIVSAFEEVMITFKLKELKANIPSFWHVRRLQKISVSSTPMGETKQKFH